MRSDRRPTVVPTVFDESLLANDLKRLPQAAKSALCSVHRHAHLNGGIPRDRLKRCQADARDRTDLAGCVKIYVPWPDGPWGIVFRAGEDPRRPFALYTIAYGRRHPGARHISVYQLAHQRVHPHRRRT
jgi:hypothetical protein